MLQAISRPIIVFSCVIASKMLKWALTIWKVDGTVSHVLVDIGVMALY